MFFLSDLSNFARLIGVKEQKPKKNLLRRSILSLNTANNAATGAGLGWAIGRATTKGYGGERAGIIAGLGTGAAIGAVNQYKKLNNKIKQ